ncbi:MAG: FAD-dependent oxidoreductase [Pseudomonadota bacterium]
MNRFTRRHFIRTTSLAVTATSVLGWATLARAGSKASGRVVVIGGGFGGATCARYLKRLAPGLDVTLVERDARFMTCPFSNMVLGGIYDMDFITHGYDKLGGDHGVNVVHDSATAIDADGRKVSLAGGQTLEYDRLVVSPGIDFRWGAVEGYDAAASEIMPHAWKAGPQTTLLRDQLRAMPPGGVVVIAPPANPFRCPPGPYERASMMAHWLKQHNPTAKILIFDAKEKFSKQPLFQAGWEKLYPGMIEWIPESQGGAVARVDTATMTVHPIFGKAQKADVVNLIPPQKAGAIAHDAGLAGDMGWCAVNQRTFESAVHPKVHVIGDASVATPMPKSGFAANSQGKVCATAIVAALAGEEMPEPSYVNTCYSLLGPRHGISVAAVYRTDGDNIVGVQGAGGVSPADASEAFRAEEARYTVGWYQSITSSIWG